jgi:hypothetical protein
MSRKNVAPGKSSATVHGAFNTMPEATFGVELASTITIALVKEYGPVVAGAIVTAIKGGEDAFVSLQRSSSTPDEHMISLSFQNLLPHAVYLEDLWLIDPADHEILLSPSNKSQDISFDSKEKVWGRRESLLPVRLAPGSAPHALDLKFKRLAPGSDKKLSVELGYTLSRLDKPGSRDKRVKVALRNGR